MLQWMSEGRIVAAGYGPRSPLPVCHVCLAFVSCCIVEWCDTLCCVSSCARWVYRVVRVLCSVVFCFRPKRVRRSFRPLLPMALCFHSQETYDVSRTAPAAPYCFDSAGCEEARVFSPDCTKNPLPLTRTRNESRTLTRSFSSFALNYPCVCSADGHGTCPVYCRRRLPQTRRTSSRSILGQRSSQQRSPA